MQKAIHKLRCLRAQTGSSYPLAGKCVNHYVLRVFINTNKTKIEGLFVAQASDFGVFVFKFIRKFQTPQAEACATKTLMRGRIQPAPQFLLALE
jgi:hypothetical protein